MSTQERLKQLDDLKGKGNDHREGVRGEEEGHPRQTLKIRWHIAGNHQSGENKECKECLFSPLHYK